MLEVSQGTSLLSFQEKCSIQDIPFSSYQVQDQPIIPIQNPQVEPDHLKYFKFIGRMIGKALFDECLLECYFVKSLYKIMTGEPLNFTDVRGF
jgi:E3 ubiquitin-protein ligase HUWE1